MKNAKKVLVLLLVLTLALMPALSFAALPDFGKNAKSAEDVLDDKAESIMGTIINLVTYVAWGIAIIMVLVLGTQYMIATPAKKAELKGKMWSMLIGVFLVAGGTTILNAIISFADSSLK